MHVIFICKQWQSSSLVHVADKKPNCNAAHPTGPEIMYKIVHSLFSMSDNMNTFVHAQLSTSLYCQHLASDLASTNKYSFAGVRNAGGAVLYITAQAPYLAKRCSGRFAVIFNVTGSHGSAHIAFCDDVHGQRCALKCTVIVLYGLSRSALCATATCWRT